MAAAALARPRLRMALRSLTLGAVAAVLLAPGLVVGPTIDGAIFVVAGTRIRTGGMLYSDVWDHKPPGVFLLHAASQTVLPWLDPWLLAWLLSLLATAVTVLILDSVFRTRAGARSSFLWSLAATVLIAAYPISLGGGQTETYAVPFLAAALGLLALRRPSIRRSAAVGILLAVACLFSLLSAAPAAALALADLLARPVVGNRAVAVSAAGAAVRRFVALAAAGAVLPLAALAWIVARGALSAAIDELVTYDALYRQVRGPFLPSVVEPVVITLFAAPFVVAGLAAVVARGRSLLRDAPADLAAALWLVGYLVMIPVSGGMYPHYLILVAPPIALLGLGGTAWIARWLASDDRARSRRTAIVAVDTVALVVFSSAVLLWHTGNLAAPGTEWRGISERVAAQVQEVTKPGDSIFVWGDHPEIYLLADRRPAARFVHQLPMVTPAYWTEAQTRQLVDAWRAAPPAAIVEASGNVPMWPGESRPGCTCAQPHSDARTLDTLGPIRQFVSDRYVVAATVDGLRIYVPRR